MDLVMPSHDQESGLPGIAGIEAKPKSAAMPSSAKRPADHYDAAYFNMQSATADTAAQLDKSKFVPFLNADHRRVLDFGCARGALLQALPIAERVGVEINPVAAEKAAQAGIEVHSSLSSVSSHSIDAVISNHAIEHVEAPLDVLREMVRVLKPGGLAVLVVPCDRANYPFSMEDKDFHLYSWSEGNFGNLARAAGFDILDVREIVHRWPPKIEQLHRLLGTRWVDVLSRVYGRIRRDRTQVRLVARTI